MTKSKRKRSNTRNVNKPAPARTVNSLYDQIVPGEEYASITSLTPAPGVDMLEDVVKGLRVIENIRQRPCLAYIGDVVTTNKLEVGVDNSDDVPFQEMIRNVGDEVQEIDLFLATKGGLAEQVERFVDFMRPRFSDVSFLIPSYCMSAGTLFALSGNNIYMTSGACLGPIDPQMVTKTGIYAPAQSLLRLMRMIQSEGQRQIEEGKQISWTLIELLDSIDKKELGNAISQTDYSVSIATKYLQNYKLCNLDESERETKSGEIAKTLADHETWLSHGHSIRSNVLNEIGLDVCIPNESLNQAMISLWALCTWLFDKTPLLKMVISGDYKYCRHQLRAEADTEHGGHA